jgi:hypothetical protein
MMIKPNLHEKFWATVTRLLGITSFAVMILTAGLYFHYADTRPTLPEEQTGRINPLNVHGRIVYLTDHEQLKIHILQGAGIGMISTFAAAAYFRLKKP